MIITIDNLREHNACPDQIVLFEERFGKSVMVTKARCLEYSLVFGFYWAARHLLSSQAWPVYWGIKVAAQKAYMKDNRPKASLVYQRAVALAFWEASKIS